MIGQRIADAITANTPTPPWWVLTTAFLIALAVALAPRLSGLRHISTAVHELGHATACVCCSGRVERIQLYSNEGGRTSYADAAGRFGQFMNALTGYAAPGFAGWGIAALVTHGYAAGALTLAALAVLAVLVLARDWKTLLIAVPLAAVFILALFWAPGLLQVWLATALAVMLPASQTHSLVAATRLHAQGGPFSDGDDAEQLAEITHIPGMVWVLLWWATMAWCLFEITVTLL